MTLYYFLNPNNHILLQLRLNVLEKRQPFAPKLYICAKRCGKHGGCHLKLASSECSFYLFIHLIYISATLHTRTFLCTLTIFTLVLSLKEMRPTLPSWYIHPVFPFDPN